MKHHPTLNIYLGKAMFFTPEEMEYYGQLEKKWRDSQSRLTLTELFEIFPQGKSIAKRQLKKDKQSIRELLDKRRSYSNRVVNKAGYSDKFFFEWIRDDILFGPVIDRIEKRIKKYRSPLSKPIEGGITDKDIEHAREVSIEDLFDGELSSKGSLLVGKCCFHEEKTGSFTIYEGDKGWYCFGCGVGGSAIDFIMRRDDCDLITAVKKLI